MNLIGSFIHVTLWYIQFSWCERRHRNHISEQKQFISEIYLLKIFLITSIPLRFFLSTSIVMWSFRPIDLLEKWIVFLSNMWRPSVKFTSIDDRSLSDFNDIRLIRIVNGAHLPNSLVSVRCEPLAIDRSTKFHIKHFNFFLRLFLSIIMFFFSFFLCRLIAKLYIWNICVCKKVIDCRNFNSSSNLRFNRSTKIQKLFDIYWE